MPTRLRVVLALGCAGILLALLLAKKPWDIAMPPTGVPACMTVFGWWAGAFNALVLAIAAVLAPLWAGGDARPVVPCRRTPTPRWVWPLVLAAVALCAAANAPRLPSGLWDDETYSVRKCIVGEFRVKDDGSLRFKKVPWRETVWYFKKPNNHILNSVLARLANDAWVAVTRPAGLPFSEPVLRMPAFLAGVGSLAALAWLLARLGLPGAGVLAAWLMALHPWQARFVPEARGYAFLFLLVPLACLAVLRALETGQWRWWLAFACAQLALIAAWSGALGSLALLNAGVACAILCARCEPAARWTTFTRFLASCVLAGMAAIQLYLPCVPQFLGYAGHLDDLHIDATWITNVASRFLTGHSWTVAYTGDRLPYMEGALAFAQSPVVFVLVAFGGLLALVAGAVRLAGKGFPSLAFLPVLLLPAPLMVAAAMAKGIHLLEWYVVGALPGLLAVAGTGLAWAAGAVSARWKAGLAVTLLADPLAGSHRPDPGIRAPHTPLDQPARPHSRCHPHRKPPRPPACLRPQGRRLQIRRRTPRPDQPRPPIRQAPLCQPILHEPDHHRRTGNRSPPLRPRPLQAYHPARGRAHVHPRRVPPHRKIRAGTVALASQVLRPCAQASPRPPRVRAGAPQGTGAIHRSSIAPCAQSRRPCFPQYAA